MLIRPLGSASRPGLDPRKWLSSRTLSIPFLGKTVLIRLLRWRFPWPAGSTGTYSATSESTRRCRDGGGNGKAGAEGKNFEEDDDNGRCRGPGEDDDRFGERENGIDDGIVGGDDGGGDDGTQIWPYTAGIFPLFACRGVDGE